MKAFKLQALNCVLVSTQFLVISAYSAPDFEGSGLEADTFMRLPLEKQKQRLKEEMRQAQKSDDSERLLILQAIFSEIRSGSSEKSPSGSSSLQTIKVNSIPIVDPESIEDPHLKKYFQIAIDFAMSVENTPARIAHTLSSMNDTLKKPHSDVDGEMLDQLRVASTLVLNKLDLRYTRVNLLSHHRLVTELKRHKSLYSNGGNASREIAASLDQEIDQHWSAYLENLERAINRGGNEKSTALNEIKKSFGTKRWIFGQSKVSELEEEFFNELRKDAHQSTANSLVMSVYADKDYSAIKQRLHHLLFARSIVMGSRGAKGFSDFINHSLTELAEAGDFSSKDISEQLRQAASRLAKLDSDAVESARASVDRYINLVLDPQNLSSLDLNAHKDALVQAEKLYEEHFDHNFSDQSDALFAKTLSEYARRTQNENQARALQIIELIPNDAHIDSLDVRSRRQYQFVLQHLAGGNDPKEVFNNLFLNYAHPYPPTGAQRFFISERSFDSLIKLYEDSLRNPSVADHVLLPPLLGEIGKRLMAINQVEAQKLYLQHRQILETVLEQESFSKANENILSLRSVLGIDGLDQLEAQKRQLAEEEAAGSRVVIHENTGDQVERIKKNSWAQSLLKKCKKAFGM